MALERSLSEILDECIDRVAGGEGIDACLADYPEYAIELRDELEAAARFRSAFDFQPSADSKRAARLRMHEALERRQSKRINIRIGNPLPRSWFATGTRIAATAAAVAVAIVASGTGTVLAAQGATPGDLLYPVKRTGEQVQLAFAFSDSREAELRDTLVERRMKELDEVAASGRERFVADLVEEIIEHSNRAQELAVAPVKDIVATLPEIDPPSTDEPDSAGDVDGDRKETPKPTPTPRPVGRADKQVSVTPVLALTGELDRIDEHLKEIEGDVLEERSREELARLRRSLNQNKKQLTQLMNRADQVHDPDVVERSAGRDDSPDEVEPAPTPTPTLAGPSVINLDGRATGTIQDVIFQSEHGKLVRVDVLVTLDADGSLLLVQIVRGGTRLLKSGKGASVQLLRPDQHVELRVDARSGEVLAMSILDTRSEDHSGNNGKEQKSSSSGKSQGDDKSQRLSNSGKS